MTTDTETTRPIPGQARRDAARHAAPVGVQPHQVSDQHDRDLSDRPERDDDAFSTLDWSCQHCGRYNRHHLPQDGVARQASCKACNARGMMIVPNGSAGRGQMRMRVQCDRCQAERDTALAACWKCAGDEAEPAQGYVISSHRSLANLPGKSVHPQNMTCPGKRPGFSNSGEGVGL